MIYVGHPHHFPPLALHSNLSPNIFIYHNMANPSTHPCLYYASTNSYPPNCTNSSIGIYSLLSFEEETRLANSFVASFILDFSCSLYVAKLALQFASKILESPTEFHLSPHWRAPHNSMPYIRHYFPHSSPGEIRKQTKREHISKAYFIPYFE